jgi:primary-amine oxidase
MPDTKRSLPEHPLDPLTATEITTVRDIVAEEKGLGNAARYIEISLQEPPKAALREYEDGDAPVDREAFVVVREKAEQKTYKGIVSLDREAITDWQHLEGVQPRMAAEEFVQVENTVKDDEDFRTAVRKRGADPDLTLVTAWSAGYDFVPEDIDRSRRLAHGIAWVRASEDERGATGYNRPLSGIHAWVDMDEMRVLKVVDTGVTNPDVIDNLRTSHYREDEVDLRDDLEPYVVLQPEGPSWEIEGNRLAWQKWNIRVGFNAREGLVLYDISYDDGDGGERTILNRASFPEVITSYNDPDPDHDWKTPFDVGEYGIGRLANSLTEGCDCLGYMHYWDGVLNDADGNPSVIENAICLHEEDHGLLWKHHDWREGDDEVRRNRRLVISFVSTIGNYDFGFYWYFYQDGGIEAEVRLTGCNATGLTPPGETETGYSEMVGPDHKAMIHQHVFNARLDFEVDGPENTVRQVDLETLPYGPGGYVPESHGEADRFSTNPHGNAAYADRTPYESESEAQQFTNPQTGRYWEIVNEDVTNEVTGQPVGYRLRQKSGDNTVFAAQPGSANWKRCGFATKHLWVTPYNDDELYPAGEFPNQSPGGEGLPAWTEADRPIRNEDLVVWYNMTQTHVCAPEDWPILPAKMMSFKLEPVHFFEENPAIDVPPEHAIRDVDRWKTEHHESMDDCHD